MPFLRQPNLAARLDLHFATLRAQSMAAVKRSAGNWKFYAAATGSALALTTNAAAASLCTGSIICSSGSVAAGPVASISIGSTYAAMGVPIGNGGTFNLLVAQSRLTAPHASRLYGAAGLLHAAGNARFLTSGGFLKKLSSGAKISSGIGYWTAGAPLALRSKRFSSSGSGGNVHTVNNAYGWAAGNTGFAALSFSNTGKPNYGWIQLVYTEGENGLPNEIRALAWAYDSSGASIDTGQTVASTPEPSTAVLALLAAGAVGIVALRRRRYKPAE